jgi:dienelactone hydrolase
LRAIYFLLEFIIEVHGFLGISTGSRIRGDRAEGWGSIRIVRKVVFESGTETIDKAPRRRRPLPAAIDGRVRSVHDQLVRVTPAASLKFEFNREGWLHWPEREDLSLEFMRLLAAAQEGGSTVSECWLTASRIDFADDNSWYREWTRTADINSQRGAAALAEGNLLTARSNWLRALSYYQAAACPFDLSEENKQASIAAMRECATNFLRHREPAGEIISIPWAGGFTLQGYYLPARATAEPAPAVICIGEPGHRKEEYLVKVARHAFERGMSLLAVDVLGDRPDASFETLAAGHKLEAAIGYVMDYLSGRDDVDSSRIAIVADGWGSSFVARGIAYDQRFAAAVCDGGIWEAHERSFLVRRAAARGDILPCTGTSRIMRNIACPLLIAVGERGWLQPEEVTEMVNRLKRGRDDVTLKIFESADTAATQGHIDNPTLANEFIFDWIAARLR